jgi:putative hydrolase of the HAD superfamily
MNLPASKGGQVRGMTREETYVKLILLDVDDTLYPKGTGPFALVSERIDEYVMAWCGIGREETEALRKRYVGAYGSTLGGLMKHHGVDPDDYLKKVHDVPVEDLLRKDERLKSAISGITHDMVVFSNGSVDYVRRVLKSLDVLDFFQDLFTIEFMDYIPKPRIYPYRKLLELYGVDPRDCVIVDDRPANILTAMDMGMKTVLVGYDAPVPGTVAIPDIYSVAEVVY